MTEQKKSFWETMPGILSATAALVTAVAGLIVVWPDKGEKAAADNAAAARGADDGDGGDAPASDDAQASLKQRPVPRSTVFNRRAVSSLRQPVNLRMYPSPDARIVAQTGPTEVFHVSHVQGNWWAARLPSGVEGYIVANYIRVLDEQPDYSEGELPVEE
jgi:hypothetical protein